MAQGVVIVDILVAQRNRRNPLADHGAQRMHNKARIALVAEAGRDPIEQADRLVGVAQQQGAGIRGDRAAIECSHHTAAIKAFKIEVIRDTLCLHRTPFPNLITLCCKSTFSDSWGRCTPYCEKCGLGWQTSGRVSATLGAVHGLWSGP